MNYGLDLKKEIDEIRGDEWKFGSLSKECLFNVPLKERERFLPEGELQNIGEEKSDCVTRAYLNALETKFNYIYPKLNREQKTFLEQYLENGKVVFSDVFIAILSGTTRNGNSLKAPAHAIYKNGLIPKKLLPQLYSFEDNYNPKRITNEMRKLGKKFLSLFPIHYEQVDAINLESALEKDLTGIGVFAWGNVLAGEYQRTEAPLNHCVLAYGLPLTYIFDNYLDKDGDFIKKLASDYKIYPYGYRVYIEKPTKKSFIRKIIDLFI